jgi:hypothetical protein
MSGEMDLVDLDILPSPLHISLPVRLPVLRVEVFSCFSVDFILSFLYLAFYKSHFGAPCFVMTSLYSTVPLTYFCGHLLDINKIILSYLVLESLGFLEHLEYRVGV